MSIIGKLIIGILRIAGLIAAPFTFGARIVVSIVGAEIGGAGGLVMSGSKVVEILSWKVKDSKRCKRQLRTIVKLVVSSKNS